MSVSKLFLNIVQGFWYFRVEGTGRATITEVTSVEKLEEKKEVDKSIQFEETYDQFLFHTYLFTYLVNLGKTMF